ATFGCDGCGGGANPGTKAAGHSVSAVRPASSPMPTPCSGVSPGSGPGGLPSPLPKLGDDLALPAGPCFARFEGIADVRGLSTLNMVIGQVAEGVPYFKPTVLEGWSGDMLRLHIANTTSALHNFSISGQNIDVDV